MSCTNYVNIQLHKQGRFNFCKNGNQGDKSRSGEQNQRFQRREKESHKQRYLLLGFKVFKFGFFSIRPPTGLLPVLGLLERYLTTTHDSALLISSRVGADLGRKLRFLRYLITIQFKVRRLAVPEIFKNPPGGPPWINLDD